MKNESAFMAYVFDILDGWSNDMVPHGIATQRIENYVTNIAFDHYIATYGIPKNANEARHMFEWAATLETTYTILKAMSEMEHDNDN